MNVEPKTSIPSYSVAPESVFSYSISQPPFSDISPCPSSYGLQQGLYGKASPCMCNTKSCQELSAEMEVDWKMKVIFEKLHYCSASSYKSRDFGYVISSKPNQIFPLDHFFLSPKVSLYP